VLPLSVQHGSRPGPKIFVSAALHGDEIIGVEIIRRLLRSQEIRSLAGTLLAVPIVNVMAFLQQSRYLPDRRDLNRTFPGSESGSLAARLANLFLKEVVNRCEYGVDLHTGALHRPNLPQIRCDLANPATLKLARSFGAPLLLNSNPTPGTLREYTTKKGIPVLLYESSEALRFDETCIRIGVQGVLNVLAELGMAERKVYAPPRLVEPVVAKSSTWVRATTSGIMRHQASLGDEVKPGQTLGVIGDPFGDNETPIVSPTDGVIIGRLNLPLVYEGDALFHIARVESASHAAATVGRLREEAAVWHSIDEPPIR
jgi:predicted deacylase